MVTVAPLMAESGHRQRRKHPQAWWLLNKITGDELTSWYTELAGWYSPVLLRAACLPTFKASVICRKCARAKSTPNGRCATYGEYVYADEVLQGMFMPVWYDYQRRLTLTRSSEIQAAFFFLRIKMTEMVKLQAL